VQSEFHKRQLESLRKELKGSSVPPVKLRTLTNRTGFVIENKKMYDRIIQWDELEPDASINVLDKSEFVEKCSSGSAQEYCIRGSVDKLSTQALAYEGFSEKPRSGNRKWKPHPSEAKTLQEPRPGETVEAELDVAGETKFFNKFSRDSKTLPWKNLFREKDWPRFSIPSSYQEDFVWSQDRKITKAKIDTTPRRHWVFTPTYNRHLQSNQPSALLDRKHAFNDLQNIRQVLIVRFEEYEHYRRDCGSDYIVLGLPRRLCLGTSEKEDSLIACAGCERQFKLQLDQLPKGEELIIEAKQGGIGYARLFAQVFAYMMGLESVWMMDDNVRCCYMMSESDIKNGNAKLEPCTFADIIDGIHRIVDIESRDVDVSSFPGREKCPITDDRQTPRCSAPDAPLPEKPDNRDDYSGRREEYAVVGMPRDPRKYGVIQNPMCVTHSVYSFFWLNVKSTVERGVLYPPKTFWEDLAFNQMCEEKDMVVLKVRRFFHLKKNLQRQNKSRQEYVKVEVKVSNERLHSFPPVEKSDAACGKFWNKILEQDLMKDFYVLSCVGKTHHGDHKKEFQSVTLKLTDGHGGLEKCDDAQSMAFETYETYEFDALWLLDEHVKPDSGGDDATGMWSLEILKKVLGVESMSQSKYNMLRFPLDPKKDPIEEPLKHIQSDLEALLPRPGNMKIENLEKQLLDKTTGGCIRAVVYAKANKAIKTVIEAISAVRESSPPNQKYHVKLLLSANLAFEEKTKKELSKIVKSNQKVRLFSTSKPTTSKPDDKKSIPKMALVLIHLIVGPDQEEMNPGSSSKLQDTEGKMLKQQNKERPSPVGENPSKKARCEDPSATAGGSSGEGGASTAAGEEAEATRTSPAVGASITGDVSKLGGKASTQKNQPSSQSSRGGADASPSQASRGPSSNEDVWGKRRKSQENDPGAVSKKKAKVFGNTPQDQVRAGAPGSQNPGPTGQSKDPKSYSSRSEDDAGAAAGGSAHRVSVGERNDLEDFSDPTLLMRTSKNKQGRLEDSTAARSSDNSMKDDEKAPTTSQIADPADESKSSPRETSRDQPTNVEEETSESASSAARGSEQGGLHGSATTQGAQSAIFTLRGGGTEDDPHMCDSLAEES